MPKSCTKYPFDTMKKGEWFPVKLDDLKTTRSAADMYTKRHPGKVFVVQRDESGYFCIRSK